MSGRELRNASVHESFLVLEKRGAKSAGCSQCGHTAATFSGVSSSRIEPWTRTSRPHRRSVFAPRFRNVRVPRKIRPPADWQSATQQAGGLRYEFGMSLWWIFYIGQVRGSRFGVRFYELCPWDRLNNGSDLKDFRGQSGAVSGVLQRGDIALPLDKKSPAVRKVYRDQMKPVTVTCHLATLNGHYDFHYDEALANWGPAKSWTANSWQELNSSGGTF